MKNALAWLEGDLSPEMRDRYDQWRTDDAGADLIAFMEGLDVIEMHIWALQEVYEAAHKKDDYEKVLRIFQKALTNIEELPH